MFFDQLKCQLRLIKNEKNHIIYDIPTDETSFIEINSIDPRNISVSLPLRNSVYQYRVKFCSIDCAVEYIENIWSPNYLQMN